MSAKALIVFLAVALLAAVSAFPQSVEHLEQKEATPDEDTGLVLQSKDSTGEESKEEENLGLRFRRVTCDILSISLPWGSVNHAACAAHCLAKNRGFKGGRCRDGVCHCRK